MAPYAYRMKPKTTSAPSPALLDKKREGEREGRRERDREGRIERERERENLCPVSLRTIGKNK